MTNPTTIAANIQNRHDYPDHCCLCENPDNCGNPLLQIPRRLPRPIIAVFVKTPTIVKYRPFVENIPKIVTTCPIFAVVCNNPDNRDNHDDPDNPDDPRPFDLSRSLLSL